MSSAWTTFPLLPINSDGSCGCGDPACGDSGKHPAVRWGRDHLGAGVQLPIPPGHGVGLATGERSGVVVIDLDMKNGVDGVASLALLGEVPETLAARTGSGGLHLYFEHPGFPIRNSAGVLGPGIDVRGDGGYVVLPPSPHRSGGRYEWAAQVPIAPLPAWLLAALKSPPKARKLRRETLERLAKIWKRSKSVQRQELGDALLRVCGGEAFADHGERDVTAWALATGLAGALPDAEPEKLVELFAPSIELMAGEGSSLTLEEMLDKLTRAYAGAETGAWTSRMVAGDNGAPKVCVGNVVMILESHSAWAGVLAYDERRGEPFFAKPPPWGAQAGKIEDVDGTRLATWCAEKQRLPIGEAACLKALVAVAHATPRDAVREYLEGLEWDGVPRLDAWLVRYAGAEDSAYTRAVSARFAISAVARTFDPGCKVDTMLILEGGQGAFKSTLLRALVGDAFFSDDLPDLTTNLKDAKDYLRGPWLIEVKELDAFNKAEVTRIKGFVDTRTDRYRRAYGFFHGEQPRRCVFAGTTNAEHYFRDATGNRRYWPVRVERCDDAGLAAARDQLWAEAVARYDAGEQWHLTPEEEALAKVEQEARMEIDPWEESISKALSEGVRRRFPMPGEDPFAIQPGVSSVTTGEVLEHVIGIEVARRGRGDEMRVAAILKRFGWGRKRITEGGAQTWRYFNPKINNSATLPTSGRQASGGRQAN
jgi:predicted P-loop ATPase